MEYYDEIFFLVLVVVIRKPIKVDIITIYAPRRNLLWEKFGLEIIGLMSSIRDYTCFIKSVKSGIKTMMNIEMVSPNHLYLLDNVEPTNQIEEGGVGDTSKSPHKEVHGGLGNDIMEEEVL
ncbi:hypothetical protein CR513_09713, partial [Mucuna pruriens]